MTEIKTGIVSLAIHGGGLAIRLAFMLVLLRYSSPEVMGLYGLAVSLESVSIYLAGLEFHTFTARRFARNSNPIRFKVLMRVHRQLLIFTTPLSAVIGVVAAICLNFSTDLWTLIPLGIVLSSGTVMQELSRYLNLVKKPINSIFINFLRSAAWQPLVLFFLADTEHLIRCILWLWAIFSILGGLWGIWALREYLTFRATPKLSYILFGLGNARAYYVIATASILQGNLERFILQLMLGPSAVGVFSFFQTLANTLGSVAQAAVLNVALPNLLIRFNQKAKDRFLYLKKIMKRVLAACLSISIIICIFAIPLIHVLSKSEYTKKLWILPTLLVSQSLLIWTQPIHLALYASHKDNLLISIMVFALISSLIFDVMFIFAFGVAGAVIAPFVVGVAIVVLRNYWLKQLRNSGVL